MNPARLSETPEKLWFLTPILLLLILMPPAHASGDRAPGQCSTLLVSGNPEYPPLLWRDRTDPDLLVGAVPALMKEILDPLGMGANIRHIGSWARVQHLAKTGELDMVAGAFMTTERFTYMDYILPPILQLPTAIWVPSGKEFLYRHWPDLLGKVGSTLINNSFGQNFDRYAEENLEIIPVRSINQSFQMALANRVDYVIYERLQGQSKLAREGLADRFTALDKPVSSEGLFFTFPKQSPCNNEHFREAFADRLYTLVQNGRVEQLIEEYSNRYINGE